MTSEQVREKVENAIAGQWHRSNLHGVDLRRALVPPQQIGFVWADGSPAPKLWLVLREHAAGGYVVVYDDGSDQFGLAELRDGYAPCCFGLYGDFFAAFEAM